jgi:transcriptional regulator of nitric oxide reductase
VGFSGQPIDIVVGLDLAGRIAGAVLYRHNEPVLVIGVPDQQLKAYVAGFAGFDIVKPQRGEEVPAASGLPDTIAGATISSGVIRDAIIRAARAVARHHGIIAPDRAGPRLQREAYQEANWPDLVADGSIVRMRLTRDALAAAMQAHTGRPADGSDNHAQGGETFIELFVALLTPARIGQNLLGQQSYTGLIAGLEPGDHLIFLAANGAYSFKGTRYRRSGVFDRLQIVQGDHTIQLLRDGYQNVESLKIAGAPELREIGLFRIPAGTGFDPVSDWQLELLVQRDTADGGSVLLTFPIDYRLPAAYRIDAEPATASAAAPTALPPFLAGATGNGAHWLNNWRQRIPAIAVLTAMLVVLSAILVFQDAIVRHPRLYRQVRLWYLAVTLFWLGLYAGAQLSVFNVLTFVHSLLTGFRWEFFLLDPLIFILWSFVAVALLFWGRGVFCGWLCPFGALQELLNELARALRIPQIKVPFGLHERLWPIKHIIFLGLLAVSLSSMQWAVIGTEVEPFKTAITLKFVRSWPFVAYAIGLLIIGLFIERFYCRYLCPLGAALAIPARLRMFEWLKRRFQCGRDCQICALNCTVQAIHPTGEINPNECIYCLACQANYSNDHLCPPLVQRRRRREKLLASNAAYEAAQQKTGAD